MFGCDHELFSDSNEVGDSTLDLYLEGQWENEWWNELLHEEFVTLPFQTGRWRVVLLIQRLDVGGHHYVVDDQVAGFRLWKKENELIFDGMSLDGKLNPTVMNDCIARRFSKTNKDGLKIIQYFPRE